MKTMTKTLMVTATITIATIIIVKTHSSSEIWTGRCIRYPLSSKDATSRALKRGYGESPVKTK